MKVIFTLFISFCAAVSLRAQFPEITGLTVDTDTETVKVSFRTTIDRKAAPNGTTVVYAPVITDGQHRVSLPAVIVQGRRAAVNWERHEWAANLAAVYADGTYAKNGQTVNYTATVPFQPWMHDSRIDMETVTAGCGTAITEKSPVTAHILPAPEPETLPEPVWIEPEPTVMEILQSAFSFILPDSEYDPAQPIRFYHDERDNALTVYYKIDRYDIEEHYSNNHRTLINLTAAIRLINESDEAHVTRVVVAGFASPEGPAEYNDKLAWNRAEAVINHLTGNTGMTRDDIILFNGSADWRGLRLEIEKDGNVPARDEALEIINHRPVWDATTQTGRITLLRKLRGGATYDYLKQHIFPKLRNGAFIRVYFDMK